MGENTNFYNKWTPKEQSEKFGIISVHFEPFEDMEYLWEDEYITIEKLTKNIKELAYSTVFQGYRYYFKDGEHLRKFCEMAEMGVL